VLLAFIKKPIKALTGKIQNEKLRKLVNKIFIIFAFLISAAAWLGLNYFLPQYFSYQPIEVLLTGAFSVVLYAVGDGIITRDGAKKLVEEIISDTNEQKQKSEKKEKTLKEKTKETGSAVADFLKKVK
jgi:hypothetical protein